MMQSEKSYKIIANMVHFLMHEAGMHPLVVTEMLDKAGMQPEEIIDIVVLKSDTISNLLRKEEIN